MELQNFIVLGMIPGTHIQITFQLWMQAIAALLSLLLVIYAVRHRHSFYMFIFGLYVQHVISHRKVSITL